MKKWIAAFLCIVAVMLSIGFTGCAFIEDVFKKFLTVNVTPTFKLSSDPASESIGFEVKNRQTVYLFIQFNITNDSFRDATIPVEVLISDEFDSIDTEKIGAGSPLTDRQAIEKDGVKYWQYTGEIRVESGVTTTKLFVVSFRANSYNEQDYKSKIIIRYQTDTEQFPEIKDYSDNEVNVTVKYVPLQLLNTPAGIEVTNEIISWRKIENAQGYYIGIGDGDLKRYASNSFDTGGLEPGLYTMRVCAIGDSIDYIDSDYCTFTFTKLPRITPYLETSEENGTILRSIAWDPLDGFEEYCILDGNGTVIREVTGTSVDAESLELKAGSTKLYVQPKPHSGDEIVSACVTPVSVQKLEAPAITIERQVLWETVSGADYYDVYVGGEFYNRVQDATYCRIPQTAGKEVYVIARSETAMVLSSDRSNAVISDVR